MGAVAQRFFRPFFPTERFFREVFFLEDFLLAGFSGTTRAPRNSHAVWMNSSSSEAARWRSSPLGCRSRISPVFLTAPPRLTPSDTASGIKYRPVYDWDLSAARTILSAIFLATEFCLVRPPVLFVIVYLPSLGP